jgi:hypothetical protein
MASDAVSARVKGVTASSLQTLVNKTKTKLPKGDGYPVVVQPTKRRSQTQNFRFGPELHNCGGPKPAEEACACGH